MNFKLFGKKKNQEIVKVEPKEEKKVTYLDFLRAIGKNKNLIPQKSSEERFKELFPRTINDVVPLAYSKNGKLVAMDNDLPISTRFNCEIPQQIMGFLNQSFIGWQACALMKQNPFIDRACTVPAKDAIASDYKLSYIKKEDKEYDESTADIDELKLIKDESYRKYKINEICVKQVVNKKTYGYSIVVPIVDGVDMEKPYNIDGIREGSYHGMAVIEPYWITPQLDYDSASNPASAHFYEPTWYSIGGKKIHRSWVVKTINSEVSDTLKPTYYFGGVPLTQQIYERVYAADKVANEAPMLALTKRLLIIDADIANMVANPDEVQPIMEALTTLRDNYGVYAKNPEDQIQQIDTSLADFDALIMTQYQLVASIAGMPATKLLKTTPKGFNSTGEYEQDDYNQSLIEIQENDFIPIINRHNELYTKSKFGKVIPLDVKFNPIDTPTEKEVAEIQSIKSQIAMTNISAGITTAEEERNILRSEEGSPYSGLPEELPEPEFDLPDALGGEVENKTLGMDSDFKEEEHPRDEDGKFTSAGEVTSSLPTERKYSQKKLKEIFNDPWQHKEAIKELGELYYPLHSDSQKKEIKRYYMAIFNKEIPENLISKEEKMKEEIEEKRKRDIESKQQEIENLKLPKKISKTTLRKSFSELGFRTKDYLANTGSYYLTVDLEGTPFENDFDDSQITISLRDHFKHSNDYVRPDFNIYTDTPYNWIDSFQELAKKFKMKGSLITKINKYNQLKKELEDIKTKNDKILS